MNWRSAIWIVLGMLVALAFVAGCADLTSDSRRTSPPAPQQSTPLPTIVPTPPSTPIPSASSQAPTPSNEPAYIPGKGFTPDAKRILDITALQISLERYRVAKGYYPPSLQALVPDFVPIQSRNSPKTLPVDPETGQPYDYKVSTDGMSYQLSATLSSGKQYTIVGPKTP